MVTLWLVTNVECDSITALVHLFVRHNDCPVVQCMMADKDMLERESEREVTTSSHPDLLLSCPAHLPARGDGCVPGTTTRYPEHPPEIDRLGGDPHDCIR